MIEYIIYKTLGYAILSLYLIFIFLAVQIWFLWKDIDKSQIRSESLINESFFKRNFLYIFIFSSIFMVHEFFEEVRIQNPMIFFEVFHLFALIGLILFTFEWYYVLRAKISNKSLPKELTSSIKH